MYSTRTKTVRTYRKSDPDFNFYNGFETMPRASFEISPGCPIEYKKVILKCIEIGWLTPVAHQPKIEEFIEKLS